MPYSSMAPSLMPGTDLIFTSSRHFVEHHARQLPLGILKPRIDFPTIRFYQLWHNQTQQSTSRARLRSLLLAVARTADAAPELRLAKATPVKFKMLRK